MHVHHSISSRPDDDGSKTSLPDHHYTDEQLDRTLHRFAELQRRREKQLARQPWSRRRRAH
jgi:hypothetical protein